MFKVLSQNLALLQKQLSETNGILASRHKEHTHLTNSLENNQIALKGCYDNKDYLKCIDVIADVQQFKALLEAIMVLEREIVDLKNKLLECGSEIKGLDKLANTYLTRIAMIQEELKSYGKIIQFPNLNNRQSPGID